MSALSGRTRHDARRRACEHDAADPRREHAGRVDLQRSRAGLLDRQSRPRYRIRWRTGSQEAGATSSICVAFISFSIVAICVALAPVFAGEYADRTDSVLLSSRYGRTRLVAAKISAALLFAAVLRLMRADHLRGLARRLRRGGANLPIQVLAMSSPYNLTVAQAAAIFRRARLPHDHGIRRADASALVAPALDAGRLRHRRHARAGDGHDTLGRHRRLQHILYLFPTSLSARPLLDVRVLPCGRPSSRRDRSHHDRLPAPDRRVHPPWPPSPSGGIRWPDRQRRALEFELELELAPA